MLALKRGKINVIINQKGNQPQFQFDPLNPDAQLTYLKLTKVFDKSSVAPIEETKNIVPLTITGTRYIDFLIPGLLAMGIMMSSMWGLSYGIIEKRSKKLLRRMIATPMKKTNFLISLMTVRIAMNLTEALLLILFAWLVFHITIQGSIPALIAVFFAGNIAFAGLSIAISCRTAKTEIGNGLINVVVMPMMLLSGVFFSYHNFPDKLIPLLQKLPLTMVADCMRSIFIEGAGFAQVTIPIIVLTVGGIITFALGLKFFRWY
jgi:ABC-type multidrug transport system permease subunit